MKRTLSTSLNIVLLVSMLLPLVLLFALTDEQVLNMLRVLNYISLFNLFLFVATPLFTSYKSVLGEDASWVDILTYAPTVLYGFVGRTDITLQEFLTGDIR